VNLTKLVQFFRGDVNEVRRSDGYSHRLSVNSMLRYGTTYVIGMNAGRKTSKYNNTAMTI